MVASLRTVEMRAWRDSSMASLNLGFATWYGWRKWSKFPRARTALLFTWREKKKKKKVPTTAFWLLVYGQSLLTSLLRNHAESTRNLSGIKLVSFQMQLAKYHQKDHSLQMIIPKQLTILMLWTSTKSSALQATDMGNIPHIDPQERMLTSSSLSVGAEHPKSK